MRKQIEDEMEEIKSHQKVIEAKKKVIEAHKKEIELQKEKESLAHLTTEGNYYFTLIDSLTKPSLKMVSKNDYTINKIIVDIFITFIMFLLFVFLFSFFIFFPPLYSNFVSFIINSNHIFKNLAAYLHKCFHYLFL